MKRHSSFASLVAVLLTCGCVDALAAERATAADVAPRYREFTFRENPKFNPQSTFELEEWTVPGLWEALGVQVFLPTARVSDSRLPRNPVIYSQGRLTGFVNTIGGGLLSGIVIGDALYYSYGWGSGLHRSVAGRLRMKDDRAEKHESAALVMADVLLEKTSDDRVRVRVRAFPQTMSAQPLGWIDHRENRRLRIIDDAGREIALELWQAGTREAAGR